MSVKLRFRTASRFWITPIHRSSAFSAGSRKKLRPKRQPPHLHRHRRHNRMKTHVIAGLGNPGPTYQWTRHNAGFLFLDRLAHLENISISKKSFAGLAGEWNYAGHRLILLKPQTFMNLSGNSVMQALQFHNVPLSNLIVIHDELDLPFGAVRFKNGGGHG